MKLTVLFFSILRDLVGAEQLLVELDSSRDWKIADLLEHLYGLHPKLRDWDSSILISADLDYAPRDQELKQGQEIAIMPPVQGG
ncbi:MAG: molybdopterin converting factor small subunit [Verrucomicrobiales bacterium]|jgi:molybdopterin converting factor small subunit